MKKLIVGFAVMCVGALLAGSAAAQGVNQVPYVTNSVVSVSSTTPTLLDAGRGARSSLSILFNTNSAAGVGMRFFFLRPDIAVATQTNSFKGGVVYGTYINPSGLYGSIPVPVGWNYDSTAITPAACYGMADGAGVVVNVNVGLPVKP